MRLVHKATLIALLIVFLGNVSYSQTETEMVFVKGGTFKMGSNYGNRNEKPVHTVTLSSFYIGKYEVTVKQYKEYCAETSARMPRKPSSEWYEHHDLAKRWVWKSTNPITHVNWEDAKGYCKWLSKKTGKNYDLPTEAQWEFAAGGGIKSKHYEYSGSDNVNEVAWYDETTYERGPMEVGRLKHNELGIYDMSGNAAEWCNDFYRRNYKKGKQANPKGPKKGKYRVIRGGGWYYVHQRATITSRDGPYPNYSDYNYGFRVVINP